MFAKELMTTKPVEVGPETSIKRAIGLMLERNVSGLPVVDGDGKVCGILTEGDILKRSVLNLAPKAAPERYDTAFFQNYVQTHGTTVGDCMTRTVVSVGRDTHLFELVALMRSHNIKRLPVVEDGRLVGIVSRRDILRAITTARDPVATGDDALRLAVTTRLKSELGLGPDHVDVRVSNSVVEIVGSMTSDAQRQAVRVVAESVAGVAGIVISPPAASS